MDQWLLPTLSELVQASIAAEGGHSTHPRHPSGDDRPCPATTQAQQEWSSAIVALGELLRETQGSCREDAWLLPQPQRGLVLCGPLPVFNQPDLLTQLATWIFIPDLLSSWLSPPRPLLPCAPDLTELANPWLHHPALPGCPLPPQLLPLTQHDPLNGEQFCLVLTPEFSLVLVLDQSSDQSCGFQFAFDSDCVAQCAQVLYERAQQTYPHQAQALAHWLHLCPPVAPDYRLVSRFSRSLITALSHLKDSEDAPGCSGDAGRSFAPMFATAEGRVAQGKTSRGPLGRERGSQEAMGPGAGGSKASRRGQSGKEISPVSPEETLELDSGTLEDIQLLQALAHEVRTPLATIRTMTRLLLRRKDLAPEVLNRLTVIDHECTEQIDRFNLIFRAAEMVAQPQAQPQPRSQHLAATALDQVFQASVPRWQKQAERRSLTLAVLLPPQMPLVVSDPTMLEQALTGLMERFTRHLPTGSHIEVEVSLAGDQLKLQLQADKSNVRSTRSAFPPLANPDLDPDSSIPETPQPQFRSLGHLLMLQPETGSVSLNLKVTKNLFQALGGKLKVREKSTKGEVLTVFLPLEVR